MFLSYTNEHILHAVYSAAFTFRDYLIFLKFEAFLQVRNFVKIEETRQIFNYTTYFDGNQITRQPTIRLF